jgi:tRNA pseudouridine38-40 synthase
VPRFKLTIEYVGTRYSGWQIQKNARTIQGEIDRAVRTVTGRKDFELYGSGRTDAGVHALAQVAHLDVSTNLPPDTLVRRVNDELPADINILSAAVVPHRFHARHDAVARRYVYQIARRRTAFAKSFVWWVREPIDAGRMRDAARAFVGMRDFRSFAESARGPREAPGSPTRQPRWGGPLEGSEAEPSRQARASGGAPRALEEDDKKERSTTVLIDRLDVVEYGEDGGLILVAVEGSHFLWKMVRRIVGVLVEVGRGGMDVVDAQMLLTTSSAAPARLTAPASGLFLARVYYQGEDRLVDLRPPTVLS